MTFFNQKWLIALLTIFVFLSGFLRLIFLVGSQRIIGYANNWDMIRIESCIGVTPRDIPRNVNSPDRTLQYYVYNGSVDADSCVPSSQEVLLFPVLAVQRITGGQVFDLRQVGITQALISLFVVGGILFQYLRKRLALPALFLALVYALVYADPVNALFLNTFYAEPAVVFFLFVALALGYYQLAVKPSLVSSFLFAVSLVLLGLSKYQCFVFPVVIGVPVAIGAWLAHRSRISVIFACAAIVLSLVLTYQITSHPNLNLKQISRANSIDTVGLTLMPLFIDKERALQNLGLPPECMNIVGKSWFSTPGIGGATYCPEVWSVGKKDILLAVLHEPLVLVRLVDQSLSVLAHDASHGLLLRYLALDKTGTRSSVAPSWESLFAPFHRLEWSLFLAFPLVLTLASGVAIFRQWRRQRRWDLRCLNIDGWMTTILAGCLYLAFFSSLFGDGWVEFIKHSLVAFDLFVALALLSALVVIRWAAQFIPNFPKIKEVPHSERAA